MSRTLHPLRLAMALVSMLAMMWPAAWAVASSAPSIEIRPAWVADVAVPGGLRSEMDSTTDPRQDYYRFATGGWQDRTEIPADKPGYDIFTQVDDTTIDQQLELLASLTRSDELAVGSDEWKAVQLFAQAMDMETRDAQGIAPIGDDLARINAIATVDDLYAFQRDAPLTSNVRCGLFCFYVWPDYADSSVYAAWYSSPFLGLPSRDYYWVDDESNEEIRAAYRKTIAELLGYVGYDAPRAADAAERVYAFEKRLAEPMFRPEDWNDPANYYHPRPVADLAAANPDFDWPAFLADLGLDDLETIVVTEEDYLEAIDGIVTSTDLETIKDYLTVQVLQRTADALSDDIGETAFEFYGNVLDGVEERRPLEERALSAVNENLGFALGKLYVDAYFSPEAKAYVETMVDYVAAATRARIQALEWMSPETKAAALAKLDTLRVKVAYPDTWRTYDGVVIEESLAGTLLSASVAESRRWYGRVGQPVDRDEWQSLPQEVNAYYNASNNEIVLLAGILQPPFFDPAADLAYNYGATGNTIGHEITHAYDLGGSQFDAAGNLADWWTAEDHAEFEALMADVSAQYSAIEVLPGLFVDGELTISENIADMGGVQIAYDALQLALADAGDPGPIEGLTPDQRFFIAYTFSCVEEARDEYRRRQLQTDYHAPLPVRAVQPVFNMDAFYDAFDIEPGDPMYRAPRERLVIW